MPETAHVITRKKLIEVALPLEAINKAAAREKSIRHGHPSTLHLWWARRPLAAARAVIFSQMVDDPSTYTDDLLSDGKLRRRAETVLKARRKVWEEAKATSEKAAELGASAPEPGPEPRLADIAAEIERQRLFRIIEDLVQWENTTNEKVLQAARDEIWASWRRTCADNADHPRAAELFDRKKLPAFHDPFAGGGAIPLEAQRLGLESHASDLNPVAVLINKAMIEIPPKFAGQPPVNPESRKDKDLFARGWKGAQGLAEDVRYYGQWMRDEAEKRIGHLYPKVEVTPDMVRERPDLKPYVGRKLTVIAWLWARTVKSPNPAFADVHVPLASTFMLGTKVGKEAYVAPVLEKGAYRFGIGLGEPRDPQSVKQGTKLSRGANFRCLMSGAPISPEYIYSEANAGRMGARLMAVVAEGTRGRVYLTPTSEMEAMALSAKPTWRPDLEMPANPRWFSPPLYGLKAFGDLFTQRQLVSLTTLADLVVEARDRVLGDKAAMWDKGRPSKSTAEYADGVALFLALCVGRVADYCSTVCTWANNPQMEIVRGTFARQAIPMTWDFAEANIFGPSTGSIDIILGWIDKAIERLPAHTSGRVAQLDASDADFAASPPVVSTDPPYFDNIGYADLSDFFYVWLRRSLRAVVPEITTTVAVPKTEELVASPYRHGSKKNAEAFFLQGMTRVMRRLASSAHPAVPVTIYYAFKQAEGNEREGTASTGWDTFLAAVIEAGFSINGTWPMRTERSGRSVGIGTNALASSIILVCRRQDRSSPVATRREFVAALRSELPTALAHLQRGNIAPVDLAQSAIGPGMAVYTRYRSVLDAAGAPLNVRDALALINQTLDEVLAEQEGDLDADSRFALAWFDQYGFDEGEYGVADVLARAKVTAVDGLVDAGVVASKRGKVRLLAPEELPEDWDPAKDHRLTAWEVVHHLVRAQGKGGDAAAAGLVAKLGAKAELARELAYRLYSICERKKRAADALRYNGLVQAWPEVLRLAQETRAPEAQALPGLV
jgi:putative DNA methylase